MSLEYINAEDIRIPADRQRKEFKDKEILELAESIVKVGLIHAPVVNEDWTLIAGERRLRALAATEGRTYLYGDVELDFPEIPVHVISNRTPQLLVEIELEENLRRVNLTAMEEAQAIAKLHGLKSLVNPKQTMKETSIELAKMEGHEPNKADEVRVAEALLVENFKDDPEVQKASKVSLSKAARVAKKKMEIDLVRALGNFDSVESSSMLEVIHGDALEIIPTLPKDSFDIMLFDPPYGVGADTFGAQGFDLGHQYTDNESHALDLISGILRVSMGILKPSAHVLMFCAFEHFAKWKTIYEQRDFKVWPRPLIWAKGTGHLPVPTGGPRYTYECILFATRGGREVATVINDVLFDNVVRDKLHAAEKPAGIFETLIDFVSKPGDRILDPCCGSGPIFTAAKGREVYVTGIELDSGYAAIAKERANG